MLPKADCEHRPGNQEVDEIAKRFTVRCVGCGVILERIAYEEVDANSPFAVRQFMKRGGKDGTMGSS